MSYWQWKLLVRFMLVIIPHNIPNELFLVKDLLESTKEENWGKL